MTRPRCTLLAFLCCLPTFVFAQQVVPRAESTGRSDSASSPVNAEHRINLDVVVTDKSGKPVSGLELKDFTLLDDKQQEQILSFRSFGGNVQEHDPPVEVILLIDTVNLPFVQVSDTREQIAKFLIQNGGHLAEPVSIFMVSDDGVKVSGPPSTDGNTLASELQGADSKLRIEGRSAGVYGDMDRFNLSIRMLTAIVDIEAKKPGRKLLIWAGPGWPLLAGPNVEFSSKSQQQFFNAIISLSGKLREARIALYSIAIGTYDINTHLYEDYLKGVKTADKANPPNLALKVLAVQSGGRVLDPSNDLTAQIDNCIQDAGAFYTLTFDPPRADRSNEYHDLKVVIGRPGLTARTNAGYYNQP